MPGMLEIIKVCCDTNDDFKRGVISGPLLLDIQARVLDSRFDISTEAMSIINVRIVRIVDRELTL